MQASHTPLLRSRACLSRPSAAIVPMVEDTGVEANRAWGRELSLMVRQVCEWLGAQLCSFCLSQVTSALRLVCSPTPACTA